MDFALKTLRNGLYSLAGFAYPALLGFFVTPILLHHLGVGRYGVLALAGAFVSFLSVFDLGMSSALVRFVAGAVAEGDLTRARRYVSAGLVCLCAVGSAGFLVSIGFGAAAPHVVKLAGLGRGTVWALFGLAGIAFVFAMVMNAFVAVPEAAQRYRAATMAKVALVSVGAAAAVGAVFLHLGVIGVMAATVIETIAGVLLFARVARRTLRGTHLLTRPARQDVVKMFAFSRFVFGFNIAGFALLQADKFLIGALGSVGLVAYYAVAGSVAQQLQAAAARLVAVMLPLTTELRTLGQEARLRRVYIRTTRATALAVASIAVPVVILAPGILRAWIGDPFAAHASTALRLLVVTYSLLSLTAIPYYISLGMDHPRIPLVVTAASAAIDLALVVAFVPRWGVTGAAAAYLCSQLTAPAWIVYVERRLVRVSSRHWGPLLARLSVAITVSAVVSWELRVMVGHDLARVALVLLASIAVTPVVAIFLGYLDEADRALLVAFVSSRRRAEVRAE